MTPSDTITKLRKEIGGADPGTIYGDVLELCTAYEEHSRVSAIAVTALEHALERAEKERDEARSTLKEPDHVEHVDVDDVTNPWMNTFYRIGPFLLGTEGACRYHCKNCDWHLITVAKTDLTDENDQILKQHALSCSTEGEGARE